MITDAAIRRLNGSYGGRVRDEAYLELAQEHFLDWMRTEGLIAGDQVIFKGGTSLRKFVFGHAGRFSVDAEKLARYRRVIFARDLYDLSHLIPLIRDQRDIIKDVLFFKVWGDVVDDDRGTKPFLGGEEYRGRSPTEVRGIEEIGVLMATSLDIPAMLRLVEHTFSVMGGPSSEHSARRRSRSNPCPSQRQSRAPPYRIPGSRRGPRIGCWGRFFALP